MRPGIFIPLKTRAGSAEAPIEPGARTLWEPWETGPRLKLWRLIVPWKPLPIATADTFTLVPGSKASTVTSPPISTSMSGSRNSRRLRIAGASVFARWPSRALVSFDSLTSPWASWIAV